MAKPIKKSKKGKEAKLAAPSGAMPEMDEKYKIEDGLRTLLRAEEIRSDDDLMKKIHKHARGEKKKLTSVQDLIKLRNEKFMEKDEEESED